LYRGETSFTDGDVLSAGGGLVRTNTDLIQAFTPAADFLGLDALSLRMEPPGEVCCVDFEEQTPGTEYAVGDTFTVSGVRIPVEEFTWRNGRTTSASMAVVDTNTLAGSIGNDVNTNNMNLSCHFPGTPAGLTLWFGEYGGNLDI